MAEMKKYRLALVDDEPWVLIGLRQIISWEESGFEIVGEYGMAEDAYDALAACPVDAVITDIRLPEMSGIDLLRRLMAEGLVRAGCIVSAYRDFEYARQAMELGSCCYLLKPLAIGEVRRAAEKLRERLAEAPVRPRETEAAERYVCVSLRPVPQDQQPHSVRPLAKPAGALLYGYLNKDAWRGAWIGCSMRHEAGTDVNVLLREAELSRELAFAYANQEMVAKTQMDIASRYHEKLLIPEIAARHFVSAVYLSDCFKRATGMTVGNFIIHVRLERSRHILAQTNLPVTEIAEQVGYQDASYFSRLFRKRTGMTPESYRQLYQMRKQ